jgi:HEAT repeat protein
MFQAGRRMTCVLCSLVVASICSCSNSSELAKAKAEAEEARAQLAKAKAEAEEAQTQLATANARAAAAEAALDKETKALQPLREPFASGKTLEQWLPILLGDDPNQAVKAAEALAQLGPKAKPAVPPLIQCLRHNNRNVRFAAIDALGRIGETEQTVPALLWYCEKSGDAAAEDYDAVAISLGRLGPGAKAALPWLLQLYANRVPPFRAWIASAIKKIDPEAAAKAKIE